MLTSAGIKNAIVQQYSALLAIHLTAADIRHVLGLGRLYL